jgi:hypothetical protein
VRNAEDLFKPFEQRSADRSGLGIGLAQPMGCRDAGATRHLCALATHSALVVEDDGQEGLVDLDVAAAVLDEP